MSESSSSDATHSRPLAQSAGNRGLAAVPRRFAIGTFVLALALLWGWQSTGVISSNDGSHLALARALVQGRTHIDEDVGLTLWVDRARRGDHEYSDRPPGTAFAALWAVWLAEPLDRRWLQRSLRTLKDDPSIEDPRQALVVRPASDLFLSTYGKRRLEVGGSTLDLLGLQGTALLIGMHTAVVGALGVALVIAALRRLGVDPIGQLLAGAALGVATLWGPYSTALFGHVTAGVALMAMFVLLERARTAQTSRIRQLAASAAGLAGAWAVAADYALLLAVVPLVLLLAKPRLWPALVLGALPMAAATAAYHHAAFGSVLSIGYDHQTNFAFARERATTFSGNPLWGLWTLWGAGKGAGVLVQSPIVLLGLAGLAASATQRRWLYGLLPWMVLLVFHRTPWGGATLDHRYLVPALPMMAVGVGLAWQRWTGGAQAAWVRIGIALLLVISVVLTWANFLAWRG